MTEDAYFIVIGRVARNLYDEESATGHRTYKARGHYWTGVESWDSAAVCSDECLSEWEDSTHWSDRLFTEVDYMHQMVECPTFLNVATQTDAVAYPFEMEDHTNGGEADVVCQVCREHMAP